MRICFLFSIDTSNVGPAHYSAPSGDLPPKGAEDAEEELSSRTGTNHHLMEAAGHYS